MGRQYLGSGLGSNLSANKPLKSSPRQQGSSAQVRCGLFLAALPRSKPYVAIPRVGASNVCAVAVPEKLWLPIPSLRPAQQDDRVVVFRDRRPAAREHLQVVPRQHITNLNSLRPSQEDYALGEWEAAAAQLQLLRWEALAAQVGSMQYRKLLCK